MGTNCRKAQNKMSEKMPLPSGYIHPLGRIQTHPEA